MVYLLFLYLNEHTYINKKSPYLDELMKSLLKAEFSRGSFLLNTTVGAGEKYLNIYTGILRTSACVEVSNCCASLGESVWFVWAHSDFPPEAEPCVF